VYHALIGWLKYGGLISFAGLKPLSACLIGVVTFTICDVRRQHRCLVAVGCTGGGGADSIMVFEELAKWLTHLRDHR
jgi:RNase adaptor protein for sRNA GlmZ degradation